jgi:hypothetical protein
VCLCFISVLALKASSSRRWLFSFLSSCFADVDNQILVCHYEPVVAISVWIVAGTRPGIDLESPVQKTRGFLNQIALTPCSLVHAH